MRHANARLRTELHEQGRSEEHARGRATQYESEVGRLRGRVDELKTQLATAEDEVRGRIFLYLTETEMIPNIY